MRSPVNPSATANPAQPKVPTALVTEDHILAAIVGVIQAARQNGQSIEDVQAALLEDDALLEPPVRQLLRDIVTEAWHRLP